MSDDLVKEARWLVEDPRRIHEAHPNTVSATLNMMAERIEALEAVAEAADALITDLYEHEGAEGFSWSTDELCEEYESRRSFAGLNAQKDKSDD